jgi:hypothetical protein
MKEAGSDDLLPLRGRLRIILPTLAVAAAYAGAMVATNTRIALLDDEAIIVAIAAHPVAHTIKLFLTGSWQHEHPPFSDVLLHGWLLLTHSSLFTLRIFANLFYIGSAITSAITAGRLAGTRAYWSTLLLAFTWPFALQYGRIAGWYSVAMFLLSAATLVYLAILDDRSPWPWIGFGVISILLVWTNYFGVILLLLFCADLILFHRALVRRRTVLLALTSTAVAVPFLPLVRAALFSLQSAPAGMGNASTLMSWLASAAYPIYSIFASVAIAPWYWVLSVPVAITSCALLTAVWFSRGRRWLVYFGLALLALVITQHLTIKRVTFLLPWFFLALGLSIADSGRRCSKVALYAAALLVAFGLIGIASGRHYATTNLYEPWEQVARVVAQEARSGETVVGNNPQLFLYLDDQLGLSSELRLSDGPDLGARLYKAHGYSILDSDVTGEPRSLHGRVVLVLGSGILEDVNAMNELNRTLAGRCLKLGVFLAAPDPAIAWKQHLTPQVPVLAYRVEALWYHCP